MKKSILFIYLLLCLVSCTSNDTSQEEDRAYLNSLFEQLEDLAMSHNCSDATEWKFTTYGAKACGGVQGYIAYSIKIDEVAFLAMIENYTKEERTYNIKWCVISDCSLVNPPKSIVCNNNLPVFQY